MDTQVIAATMSEGVLNDDGAEGEYGLEDRTFRFAKQVREFVKALPLTVAHREDGRQLVRASGSVAANFIEAVECLGAKDRLMKLRTTRKEAKESRLWLRLLSCEGTPLEVERTRLVDESTQLMNIFGSIIRKSEL